MVKVSEQLVRLSRRHFAKITLGFMLPFLLLVLVVDVKRLRFLRTSLGIKGTNSSTISIMSDTVEALDPMAKSSLSSSVVEEATNMEQLATADYTSDTDSTTTESSKVTDRVNTSILNSAVKSDKIAAKNFTKTCLDPKGPLPFILLARGRSGSGSTLEVLGQLTPGEHIPGDHEIMGTKPDRIRKFLASKVGGQWVLDYLCEQQRQHPTAGLVKFKWKPYTEAMFSPAALAGLDLISRAVDPLIKVVRLRRNLLDNYISDVKHEQSNVTLISHCKPGKEMKSCVRKHKKAGVNLTLSVPNLLDFLEAETTQEDTVDKFLVNMSVPHVQVTYEKLFHQDDAEEWMKIFRFLGVGPMEGLTREQVDSVSHAFTGSSHHREAILNYEEVEQGLKGTRFESLLRP